LVRERFPQVPQLEPADTRGPLFHRSAGTGDVQAMTPFGWDRRSAGRTRWSCCAGRQLQPSGGARGRAIVERRHLVMCTDLPSRRGYPTRVGSTQTPLVGGDAASWREIATRCFERCRPRTKAATDPVNRNIGAKLADFTQYLEDRVLRRRPKCCSPASGRPTESRDIVDFGARCPGRGLPDDSQNT
jgi:hypothetical protein